MPCCSDRKCDESLGNYNVGTCTKESFLSHDEGLYKTGLPEYLDRQQEEPL